MNLRHSDKSLLRKKLVKRDLKIRDFSIGDFSRVLEIRRASLAEEFKLFGNDESGFKKQIMIYALLRRMERLTGKFSNRVYVGEVGRQIVGIAILTGSGASWHISGVMVDPKHRRRGYGKRLVSKACDDAMHFGAQRVCLLGVLENNIPARRLYQSLGFKEFEKRLYFYADCSKVRETNLPSCIRLVKQSYPIFSKLLTLIFRLGTAEKFTIFYNGKSIGVLELHFGSKKKIAKIFLASYNKYRVEGIEEALLIKACKRIHKLGIRRVMLNIDERYAKLKEACNKFDFKFLCATYDMFKSLKYGSNQSLKDSLLHKRKTPIHSLNYL